MAHLHRIRSAWRRHLLNLCLWGLLWINRFTSFRARVHWVGRWGRPRRPERPLIVLLFASAMVLLEPHEYMLWSIALGAGTSLFLCLVTGYRLWPRKRAHWVKAS